MLQSTERCEGHVLAGTLPASTDCLADPGTPAAIAKTAKARSRIARACCGPDGHCGTSDDESLAAVGWAAGACPDFTNALCTNPTTDPDG
ncbi:MAG TPA: hypothetical protein VFY38_12740, partial [Pseudonocardia sp.]|nr:hypothetical protein [Pseudonocardia sp.]